LLEEVVAEHYRQARAVRVVALLRRAARQRAVADVAAIRTVDLDGLAAREPLAKPSGHLDNEVGQVLSQLVQIVSEHAEHWYTGGRLRDGV
jgi:hypothetical protein